MTSLTDWASHTTAFGWTPNGQLATQTDPNGVVQTNSYDAVGRTTLISDSGVAGVLASFGYGYDSAGQLVSDTSTNGGATTAHDYGYDPLSQLGSVATTPAGEPTATGLFDATSAGQLTATAGGDTLVYNDAQQLTDLVPALGAAVSYLYDGNGSRTSSTVAASGTDPALATSYGYTATGALSSVTTPTTTVDYTVDGRGLRQSRTVDGSTDDFVWSTVGGLPLLLDDGDHTYLYGPSLTPVAQVDGSGTVEYMHGDLLGSVRTITDSTGAVVGASTFDAFGSRTAHTGAGDSLFGFTGNWTDPDTGLVHLRARDYDPATGQFLSVDPAVDSTKQPYAYTGNSPLNRIDPSGLCPVNGGSNVADCTPEDYGANGFWLTPVGDFVAEATFDSLWAHQWWGIGDGATMGGLSDMMYALTGQCMDRYHDVAYWFGVGIGVLDISFLSAGTADAYGMNRLAQEEQLATNRMARSWSVGDDIYALTRSGASPAWSTVRSRFWQNEAANPQIGGWSQANLNRMQRGLAPQRFNLDKGGMESMELSHEPIPQRDGGTSVVPRWPQDHASVDPFRRPGY